MDSDRAAAIPPRALSTAALCGLVALGGCMTVNIHTDGQPAQVTRHVGWLQVQVAPADRAVVSELRGVGVAATPAGWSAGWTRQRVASLGPRCRAVLWVDADTVLDEAFRRHLDDLAGACRVDATGRLPQPTGRAED